MMRFYQGQRRFYAGIDWHARTMYVCIVNRAGDVLVHEDFAANPKAFLMVMASDRAGVVICVECMFAWYWLADVCATVPDRLWPWLFPPRNENGA